MGQRVYELKDKDSGFYDHETDFGIYREEQKALGKKVGRSTEQAIQTGRLIEVRTEPKAAATTPPGDDKGKGKDESKK
jgi:hypothetical protein